MPLFTTWTVEKTPPDINQIEVSIFGPGIGEALAIHIGNHEWILVDSCRRGTTKTPASLEYLKSIGVNPSNGVQLIVATHWHNDHINGLSQIVQACPSAHFVCPQVLTSHEFRTLIELQNKDSSFPSETSEIDSIFNHYAGTGRLTDRANHPFRYGVANKCLYRREANQDVLGCEVHSLSPSDNAVTLWHRMLAQVLSANQSLRKRITPPEPNQISVALWISIGQTRILLGADLEESGNPNGGWKVVVESRERPQGMASINKVPHHGSENGHHLAVWQQMLESNPVTLIAPYYSGRKKLPSQNDVTRILSLTNRAFITSFPKDRTFRGKTGSVNRTIHEVVRKIRTVDNDFGQIRARKSANEPSEVWRIELDGRANPLNRMLLDEDSTQP